MASPPSLHNNDKSAQLDKPDEEPTYDPAQLLEKYSKVIPKLVSKPNDRKKHKGTNIPKFLLKVFFNNMPDFPDQLHINRLIDFIKRP
jgi:hypothetical protein